MYNFFNVPRSITLNSEGDQYDLWYVHDEEVNAAKWMKDFLPQSADILTDIFGINIIRSHGERMINSDIFDSNQKRNIADDYVFLRYLNTVENRVILRNFKSANLTDYEYLLYSKSEIFNNGGASFFQ
jgi:uncharacterized membrane protein